MFQYSMFPCCGIPRQYFLSSRWNIPCSIFKFSCFHTQYHMYGDSISHVWRRSPIPIPYTLITHVLAFYVLAIPYLDKPCFSIPCIRVSISCLKFVSSHNPIAHVLVPMFQYSLCLFPYLEIPFLRSSTTFYVGRYLPCHSFRY